MQNGRSTTELHAHGKADTVLVNGIQKLKNNRGRTWCSNGLMDKASDFESEDCGFESRLEYFFFGTLSQKKKKFRCRGSNPGFVGESHVC